MLASGLPPSRLFPIPPSLTSMAPVRMVTTVVSGELHHPSLPPRLPLILRDLHATGDDGYGTASSEIDESFYGSDPSSFSPSSGSELSFSSSSSSSSSPSSGSEGCRGG